VNDRLTRWLEEEEGPNSSNIQQYSRLPREALLGGEDTEAVQAKWLEQVILLFLYSQQYIALVIAMCLAWYVHASQLDDVGARLYKATWLEQVLLMLLQSLQVLSAMRLCMSTLANLMM
jgi:hypothetical protein